MDDHETILPEQRITRTAQACERCRSLKARCLPSSSPGVCRRCAKSCISCRWAEGRQQRKRRGGSARDENRHEDLIPPSKKNAQSQHSNTVVNGSVGDRNLASHSSLAVGEATPVPAGRNQPKQLHPDDAAHSLDEMSKLHDFDLTAEDGHLTVTWSEKSSLDKQFGASLAAQPEAGELLNEYRHMQYSFPFVPVTAEMTVQLLSQEKPMLLLAIMTVSSWRHRKIQMRFEKRFRAEVAERTIINPRKDFGLLQGMLVYLAWSHYFFDAKVQNTASILHLSVGMLSDLRLLQSRTAVASEKASQGMTAESNENQNRRVVLGCYFLCSTIVNEYHRPTHLKFSSNMNHWCRRFSEQPEFESDKTIELLVESRRLLDLIHESSIAGEGWQPALIEDRILTPFQHSKSRLAYWDSQPQRKEHRRLLNLIWSALENKLFGMLAHLTHGCDVASSTQQIAHFSARLEAGKTFLDTLVSIPTSESFVISLAEWTYVPRVTMDMARLSTHDTKHPSAWNVESARDRAQLNLYLDSLCYRMQNLTTFDPPTQPSPDYWFVMKNIMHSASDWYRKKKNESIVGSTTDTFGLTQSRTSTGEISAIANPRFSNAANMSAATSEHLQDPVSLDSPTQQPCWMAWTHLDFSNNFWASGDEMGINLDTNMISLDI